MLSKYGFVNKVNYRKIILMIGGRPNIPESFKNKHHHVKLTEKLLIQHWDTAFGASKYAKL